MAAWSVINNNEIITHQDLQDYVNSGGVSLKSGQTIPLGADANKALTKERLIQYANVQESNSTLAPKANNQLVAKRDVTPIGASLYVLSGNKDYNTWTSYFPSQRENPDNANLPSYIYNVGEFIVHTVWIRNIGSLNSSGNTVLTFALPNGFSLSQLVASHISAGEYSYTQSNGVITVTITKVFQYTDPKYVAMMFILSHPVPTSASNGYAVNFQTLVQNASSFNNSITSIAQSIWEFPTLAAGITNPYGNNGTIPYNAVFDYTISADISNNRTAYDVSVTMLFPAGLTYLGVTQIETNWSQTVQTDRVIFTNEAGERRMLPGDPPAVFKISFRATTQGINTTARNIVSAQNATNVFAQMSNFLDYDRNPNFVYQYATCTTTSNSCVDTLVYRDMNQYSSTYLNYFVTFLPILVFVNVGNTAPANTGGLCNFSANYNQVVGVVCLSCVNYTVYRNTNPCFTGDQFYASNGNTYGSNPSNGGCNYNANYNIVWGYRCIGCVTYIVYKNDNPCFTGNQFFIPVDGGTTYANDPSASQCFVDASYTTKIGEVCFEGDCTPREVYANSNPCYNGNQYFIPYTGITYATNPLNTFPSCSSSPNIQSMGYNTCVGCQTYLVYRDQNVCSPTFGNFFVNSVNVGNTAPANGACNTSPNRQPISGYTTCINCFDYQVYRDVNTCSSTYLRYYYDSGGGNWVDLGMNAPSNAQCQCCTLALLFNDSGSDFQFYSYYSCANSYVEGYMNNGESMFVCFNAQLPFNFTSMQVDYQGTCN